MIVWRDGEFIEGAGAIASSDRGWLIGDAVFETILVKNCIPAFLREHLLRLTRGADVLGMAHPIDAEAVAGAIAATAARNGVYDNGACRITLSRVGGPRGLAPKPGTRVQTVISIAPLGQPPSFMRLMISSRRRWTGASTNAFKCAGGYAENLLARIEAADAGADEAVMLNEFGRVACLSAANVFVISEGRVRTPPLSEGAMPGIVRAVVLEEAAKLNLSPAESPIERGDLARSTLIATNSIAGAVRCALDDSPLLDVDAARGLIAAYQRRLDAEFCAMDRSEIA